MAMSNKEMISHALRLWANYIETGDPSMGSVDADNMGRDTKAINSDQKAFVQRLRHLSLDVVVKGVGPLGDK